MLPALLALLNEILPLVGAVGGASVSVIVPVVEQAAALAVSEGPEIVAGVQKFIADLSATGAPTDAELAALQASSASLDASFEAAATAAGDPAP